MKKIEIRDDEVRAGGRVSVAAGAAAILGLLGLGISWALGRGENAERFYFSYLHNYCYFMSITLGAFFFTFIQHLVSAGWSVVVRRLAEVVMMNVLPMAILFIPILVGREYIFHWLDPNAVAHDPLLQKKASYLNQNFFFVRCAIYFVLWGGLASYFFARSVGQDETGDYRVTIQMKRVAAPTTIIFALTVSFFAFDMLMSLDPHWFSTIFGVYYFAGSILSFCALLGIIAYITQRAGRLRGLITSHHYHDIGKFTFAWTVFWAYIGFSQYMLIWYANIPEETVWYHKRFAGEWVHISWMLLWGHFIVPFVTLLSRYPKRRPYLLVVPATWVLIMHWFDLYWIVMPELPHGTSGVIPWSLTDVTCFIGLGGLFTAFALHRARNLMLIPRRDPRLAESLAFENVGG